MQQNVSSKEVLFAIALCAVAFFLRLTATPATPAEQQLVEAAQAMTEAGNYFAPSDGAANWPPLALWITAALNHISPDSLAAHRAATGLTACVWVWLVYLLARHITRQTGFALMAAVVFASCQCVMMAGRAATPDVYGYTLMTGALYCLMRGLHGKRVYVWSKPYVWPWFITAGVLAGLSLLAKGWMPLYAILLPTTVVMTLWRRPIMTGKRWPLLVAVLLCAAVCCWWFAQLALSGGTAVAEPEASPQPWHYYWRFFAMLGAWALLTVSALAVFSWNGLVHAGGYGMAVGWMTLGLLLLSLLPDKSIATLSPLCIPGALAATYLLHYYRNERRPLFFARCFFQIMGWTLGCAALLLPALHFLLTQGHADVALWRMMAAGAVWLVTAGWVIAATIKRNPVSLLQAMATLNVLMALHGGIMG